MPTSTNIYPLSEIQSDVRVVLDQNQVEAGVLEANRDTLELDEIIKQKVLHAAHQVLESAPLKMFQTSGTSGSTAGEYAYLGHEQSQAEPYTQKIERPADFLRALSFNVHQTSSQSAGSVDSPDNDNSSEDIDEEAAAIDAIIEEDTAFLSDAPSYTVNTSWRKTLTSYEMVDSDLYWAAKSTFNGIRPNPHRPAVFYNPYFDWFEFFGCDNNGRATMWYVKIPKFDGAAGSETLCFPDVLYKALLYQTASLVETAYKNLQAAQMYSSIARGFMGIDEQAQEQSTNKNK